jgi:hypothetical protein
MTTPANSPEEGTPPPDEPAEVAGQTPAEATTVPGPAVPPTGPHQPPGVPWQPAAYPFAPVARAPRAPWVNPARRGHVAAAAIVGALLFGAGGLLIGHVTSDRGGGNGDRHGVVRIGPGQGMKNPGFGHGQYPRRPGGQAPQVPNGPASSAPATVPSGSPTR